MGRFDHAALHRLRAEPLNGLHKGLPVDAAGQTVASLSAQRRPLLGGGFLGPVAAVDRASLQHNISDMQRWCHAKGVHLAPHGKTTMAPGIFAEQLAVGAWGVTVATVSQAQVCVAFGISPVLIANQVVDEAGIRWIGQQTIRGTEISFWVDSIAGVEMAERVLSNSQTQIDVLVELGTAGGRAGCRTVAEASTVAMAVAASPHLRLVGIAGYEGVLATDPTPASVSVVDEYLYAMTELADELARIGLFDGLSEVILTAGGSIWFDRVAEILTKAPVPARVILRSGCYVTHDDGVYAASTPSVRTADAPRLRPALRTWAHVSSHPEPDLVLVTMGRRDTSYDDRLPAPLTRHSRGGGVSPVAGRVTALNDQHAYLSGTRADVGDWISFGISHPCTVLERWRILPIVEDGVVVDLVHTFF